jgi:choline dehydrogenase-like flavoprotein
MALKHVNAVVVGAGAGGGVVAKELAEGGLSVVLLERGDWVKFDEHTQDELLGQRTTVLGNAYGPDDRHPRVVGNDGQFRIVRPHEGSYGNNAACVGSGTVSYGAMAWRFSPQDFRMKSTYGALEGSTLDDWPISYEDLEPFYEKAEWQIGVAGDMSGNPFAPPRQRNYPMPAFGYNREGRELFAAGKRLGLHPFPIPMARNSVPYGGRNACQHNRMCCGYACPINAKNGTHNTVIPVALATGNCELRTHCVASEVVVDDSGRARGVKYFDGENRAQYQTADLVVVSCAASETARLLLNSKSKLFPDGAGNRHDWVGRNLQAHGYVGASGLLEHEIFDDEGPGATIAINDFNHGNAGLHGGGTLCNEFIRPPYAYTMTRPPGAARWGKAHKDFQRYWYKRSTYVMGPVQEMPMFTCRVMIDPVVKDVWGVPVARITGKRHPHDHEIGRFLAAQAERWLREEGAIQTWTSGLSDWQVGGQHQAGTCRMGNDPTTSVTDKYGRVHDFDNLWIADGSLHVTNGGYNPALTIMTMGFWVGHHIVRQWKGGHA